MIPAFVAFTVTPLCAVMPLTVPISSVKLPMVVAEPEALVIETVAAALLELEAIVLNILLPFSVTLLSSRNNKPAPDEDKLITELAP